MSEHVQISLERYNRLKRYEEASKNHNEIYWEYLGGKHTPIIKTTEQVVQDLEEKIKEAHLKLAEKEQSILELQKMVTEYAHKSGEKVDLNWIDNLIEKFS